MSDGDTLAEFLNKRAASIKLIFGTAADFGGGIEQERLGTIFFSSYTRGAPASAIGSCSRPLQGVPICATARYEIVMARDVITQMLDDEGAKTTRGTVTLVYPPNNTEKRTKLMLSREKRWWQFSLTGLTRSRVNSSA